MLHRVPPSKALKARALLDFSVILLSAHIIGCARGAEAPAAMAPLEPEPQTIEEAQAQIARAKAQLDSSPMAYSPATGTAASPAGAASTASTSRAPDKQGTPPPTGGTPAANAPSRTNVPPPPPPAPAPQAPAPEAALDSQSSRTASAPKSYEGARREAAPDPCANPCRALTSMRRAVEAICRLAGSSDARCTEARQTLTESEQRIVSCRCP